MADPKKPGTTRLALFIVGGSIILIGFIVGKYAIFSEAADLKDVVLLLLGGLMAALGAVVTRFFGKL